MRKTRLVDCNPRWGESDGHTRYVRFDCPEGHADCWHVVPFTPSLEGQPLASPQQNGAVWQRIGETFETLTLTPSILRVAHPDDACAFHGFIKNGEIEFCGDSR